MENGLRYSEMVAYDAPKYAIKEDPYISTSKMAEIIGVDRRNIARNIKKLKEQGAVRRVGPDKGGFWEVIE